MGLLYHCIKIPNAITLTFFLNVYTHARFIFIGALTRLGLYKPPPEEDTNFTDNSDNYILILDGSCPSLVPIPINVVIAAIKNLVSVTQYHDFLTRHRLNEEKSEIVVEEEEENGCSICLERIEWTDDIRELCNCSHLFHRKCLDTWIDEGQITCPLCRSMLLPPKTNLLINRFSNISENYSQGVTAPLSVVT